MCDFFSVEKQLYKCFLLKRTKLLFSAQAKEEYLYILLLQAMASTVS